MRTTITVDSAMIDEVYNLTLAFQRTSKAHDLPRQITTEPTVKVRGVAMTWTTPALTPDHATALLAEFNRLDGQEVAS